MTAIQNFFKTFFLTELLKGLALTGRYTFQRKITVQIGRASCRERVCR